MKQSLDKLHKFFKLEIERGLDNHAVMGGLEKMLDFWEPEARLDGLPEDLIQVIAARVRDYGRLSPGSRLETLTGLWQRLQNQFSDLPGLPEIQPLKPPAEPAPKEAEPGPPIPEPRPTPQPQEPAFTQPETSMGRDAEANGLFASVTVMKGIGKQYAQILERLGIETLWDLVHHFPRRYNDFTRMKPINRLSYKEEVTVIGTVQSVAERSIRSGKQKITEAVVSDGSGGLRITWFSPYVARQLEIGEPIVLSGKTDQYLGRIVMNNPEWEAVDQQQLSTNRIVPVYPLAARLTQKWMRQQINDLLSYWAERVPDPLPVEIRQAADLPELPVALRQIHFPDTWEDLKKAQERLAFDEIFLLQLGVLRMKRAWQERSVPPIRVADQWLEGQITGLPFSLTGAQQRVLNDLRRDLQSGRPMNRLVQGDVGSGKTVIAALAIAMSVENGSQAAVMAPTSILAEQHYRSLTGLLAQAQAVLPDQQENGHPPTVLKPEEIRLMVGSTPDAEKAEILTGLASGEIRLVVGTHALIEEPVQFSNLKLAVVDEQHRFGVEQRAALRAKGEDAHLIVMTATPIPRSLALTVYGDLDISVVDEMPPGRQPVSTHLLTPVERERAYSLIRSLVQKGQQAFVIYPLVEESEASEARAAVEEHSRLQGEVFPDLKVSLLHGRMRPDEKDAVMAEFRDGNSDILVSTSVIEVGMDIPNATVMLIEGANRFGLAQLHQFRGRIGRGGEKSYCLMIPESVDEVENQRLQAMVETSDGFLLAERDLEQRGPGQFLGTRQSGYNELKLASMTDVRLIEKARQNAQLLYERDPNLDKPEHRLLVSELNRAWGEGEGDIS